MNNTKLFETWRRYLTEEEEKTVINERMDYMDEPAPVFVGAGEEESEDDKNKLQQHSSEIADWMQVALDVIGLWPGVGEPFDAANAAIYAIREKPLNAFLSAISVIPIYGDIVGKGTKLLLWGIRTGKTMKLGAKTYTVTGLGGLLKKNWDKISDAEVEALADEIDNQTEQPKGTMWSLYIKKIKGPINNAAAGKISA